MTRDISSSSTGTNRIDDTATVYADDWINYAYSAAGQNAVAAAGFVPVGPASIPPIPDWDVNMDGNTNIGDLGAVTGKWGLTQSCKGWIRADANNNGTVSLGDIAVVTNKWGNAGFGEPLYIGSESGTPAAQPCDTGRQNIGGPNYDVWFDGWYKAPAPGRTYLKASAEIENYRPVIDGDTDASSSAWTMLEGSNTWAQVGWAEWRPFGDLVRSDFSQYYNGLGPPITKQYPDPSGNVPEAVGSYPMYEVTYLSGVGGPRFEFRIAGELVETQPSTFAPTVAEQVGEIHALRSQMPGDLTNHAGFIDSHFLSNDVDGDLPFGGTISMGPLGHHDTSSPYFDHVKINDWHNEIWDKDCP